MWRHAVRDRVDVLHVQRGAKRFAASMGFDARACSELAIVASELGTNILKYGVAGSIEMLALPEGEPSGLMIVAHDTGPPFHSLELALQDGWDDKGPIEPLLLLRRGGIGGGLGAVARLMDDLRVEAEPGGKQVLAIRYLKGRRASR
jgi:anti-sigma regulatory factor (Ser/Thr protein kinase)